MDRIKTLRNHIDEMLLKITNIEEQRCAYIHLYGVAQFCALIAMKRGENAELAVASKALFKGTIKLFFGIILFIIGLIIFVTLISWYYSNYLILVKKVLI